MADPLAIMAPLTRSSPIAVAMLWASLFLLPLGARLTDQIPLMESREPQTSTTSTTNGPENAHGWPGWPGDGDALRIDIPESTPSNASDVVDHAYPALAMSAHSFWEYAGNASFPNVFSRNLIDQIAQRTGTNVHIRVGGTSGDFSVYNPNQIQAITLPPGAVPGGIPKGMRKGKAWYEGFANFPGVQWTYMAHMANDSDGMVQNSVLDVQAALQYIGSDLEALEIGNEIDFYRGGARPASYNAVNYLSDWNRYEDAIAAAVGDKPYQAPVFANNFFPFSIQNAFDKGQNAKGNVISAALHNYMTGQNLPVSAVQSVFMNHTNIKAKLDYFKPAVAYLKANYPDIPLHLGEVNSDTYSMNNEATIGIFGSCLWLADYMLYGATLNIARMNIQQSTGFSYASWRGVDYYGKPAAVLPPYYAHPFVADVLNNNGGSVQVVDLALGMDTFSGYGIYDSSSSKIIKVVLVNLNKWSPSDGTRPVQDVILNIGQDGIYGGSQAVSSQSNDWHPPGGWPWHSAAKVESLTAGSADEQDTAQITWSDQSWTLESNGEAYQNGQTTQWIRGSKGEVRVRVQASEAILVTL